MFWRKSCTIHPLNERSQRLLWTIREGAELVLLPAWTRASRVGRGHSSPSTIPIRLGYAQSATLRQTCRTSAFPLVRKIACILERLSDIYHTPPRNVRNC